MIHRVPYTDLLMELLSIPAVSREEAKRADFLEKTLLSLGLGVKRTFNNLLAAKPGQIPFIRAQGGGVDHKARPVILLNSHIDTVPPALGWRTDPFKPDFEKGMITALGSNDAGGSLVTLVTVFMELIHRWGDEADLWLLLSAEEEVSGKQGISAVMEELQGMVDVAVVGEPTGMQPAVAERGLMVLDAVVHGKAGHAAREEGENAICLAMKDIENISGLRFREKSAWLPDPSVKVTMISAGTSHNVIPDTCRYVMDVRSNDMYGNEKLLEMIRGACLAELTPRSMRLGPSFLDPDHPVIEAIGKTGLKPFGSSTLSDMALMPFPAVKMGPGDSSRSHTAGEYILVSELEEAVDIYTRFLTALREVLLQGNSLQETETARKTTGK